MVDDTELVGVQKTLTPVLKAKALDNRLPDPVLGERVMRHLDPGYRLLHLLPGLKRSTRIVRFRF
jgi:hypothetical protein